MAFNWITVWIETKINPNCQCFYTGLSSKVGNCIPCYSLPAVPYQLHSIPPNWEAHAATGGPKFSPSPLSPPEKALIPETEIRSTRNRKLGPRGSFEWKVLMHYSYFVPLSKQGFTHYNCCWVPLTWKQSSLLIHYSCCWAPVKERYFTHYSCKEGQRQVPRLPFLKHTTAWNHDNDLTWKHETD